MLVFHGEKIIFLLFFYEWNLHGGNSRCDLTVMTNGDPYLTLSEKNGITKKNVRVKKVLEIMKNCGK